MDIAQCPIAMPEVNEALAQLRATRPRDGHYSLRAHSGPRVFAQTNDSVADTLADCIATTLADDSGLLVDAFCGAGFFTKRLAPQFERVIGIDWDRFAIDAARKDARPNETYLAGDVAIELGKASRNGGLQTADEENRRSGERRSLMSYALIVDPPATGLSPELRRVILDSSPRTMIYVSCNPPTLARDLAELQQRFAIVSITPFDMFPQTAEIEVVAHLKLL
jgi:tRNA/tmRNA/rRNA uracil-C5-methylase (TrmA/RlmC/RlmD family)